MIKAILPGNMAFIIIIDHLIFIYLFIYYFWYLYIGFATDEIVTIPINDIIVSCL